MMPRKRSCPDSVTSFTWSTVEKLNLAQWHGKLELFSACLPQHVVEELLCRRGRRVSAKQLLVSNEILGSSDDGERDHLSERPARQLRAKPSSRFSPTETVEDATETFELFRRRGRDKEGAFTLYSLESWRDRPSCRRQIEVEKCLEQKGLTRRSEASAIENESMCQCQGRGLCCSCSDFQLAHQ